MPSIFFGEAVDLSSIDALIIGIIGGAAISWLIAIWSFRRQKKEETKKLEIARTYVLRTIVINLKVIFSGGDERMPATDERLQYFTSRLGKYRQNYSDDSADEVFEMLSKWQRLPPGGPVGNPECEKVVIQLEEFLNKPGNRQPVI
jgi:hypothetical protein